MAIELRLLRYFAVVAEELHVGHAAARLFISQPALSQQIRALEDQVGVPLFVRHPRGMRLTEAGEVLLAEARELLGRSERLERTVDELRTGRTSGLRIGLPPGLSRALLPELLAPLREREPDARIEVRELTTPDQLVALHDGSLDLGLVREPVDDDGLARRSLLVERLGVALPAGHRLAGRESISLREVASELFVCFPRPWAPALHDVVADAWRGIGEDLRFQDSAHASTTESMVASGLALTLAAPPWLEGAEGIVWRPLADATIEIRTAAAWRPGNHSPLLRALVDSLPAGALSDAPSPAPPATPASPAG
jgi:DNA-binding transcriptional LysR family regulator